MFVLGHMGIGNKIVSPWSEGLPKRWILFGTLLPDIIDKVLYYGLVSITGLTGSNLGLISGTRTFGHTAIFLLMITGYAMMRRSRMFIAIALGLATHLLLDNLGETFKPATHAGPRMIHALLFPFMGVQFPVLPFRSAHDHITGIWNPYTIGGEIVGGALLAWEYWKSSHRKEILSDFQLRRIKLRRIRHRKTGTLKRDLD